MCTNLNKSILIKLKLPSAVWWPPFWVGQLQIPPSPAPLWPLEFQRQVATQMLPPLLLLL